MRKLLLAALTVTVLAACGTTAPTPTSSAPAAPAPTVAKTPEAPTQPAPSAPAAPALQAPVTPAAPAQPAAADAQAAATGAAAAVTEIKPADAAAPAAETKPADADKPALPDVVHATIHAPAGEIHINLFHKTAPLSVENFVKLTQSKFFDGLSFHRVEPGFVIQGGDPNTREGATGIPGTGGPGYTIPAEVGPSNPEKHIPGTLGMADAGPGTAGSQFYITLATTPHLDGRYTVFGRVVSDKDLEVAKQIKKGDRFTVTIDDAK